MSDYPPPPGPPTGPPSPPLGPPPSGPPPAYQPHPTLPPPGWSPQAEPTRRSRTLGVVLGVVAAVLVIGAAVLVPLVLAAADDDEPGAGEPTLEEVETFADLSTLHTEEDQDYPQSPPAGGPHSGSWLDCGVYDEPVRDENVVHDLEHGTVWITYEPGLDEESVSALEELLPQNGILSPYDDLRAPVVVTVWERQLALTGADDPRLELFIAQFGAGETAPEPTSSCAGGIDNPSTGTVA
jgi:hypothetical protein